MSSKRGRKRNDNLPPNRARDVQRAFRARRAAHLQALEQRVAELEEENNYLRQVLSLPPSNRPPLGSGPTGKDKSRIYESTSMPSSISQSVSFTVPSREPSAVGSPGSWTDSHSPHTINVSMSSLSTRPMQVIDVSSSQSSDIFDGHQSKVPGPTNSSYQPTPVSTPLPLRPPYSACVDSSLPSSYARNLMSSDACILNDPVYSHSSDHPLSQSYSGQSFASRYSATREERPRHYSYTPSPFQTHHYTGMRGQSPLPATTMRPQSRHELSQHLREPPMSYTSALQRRTDPYGFSMSQSFSTFPHPPHIQVHQQLHHQLPTVHHPIRHVELMRNQSNVGHLSPSPGDHPYGPDGHLNHHPIP